jgi:hypothetical protein
MRPIESLDQKGNVTINTSSKVCMPKKLGGLGIKDLREVWQGS